MPFSKSTIESKNFCTQLFQDEKEFCKKLWTQLNNMTASNSFDVYQQ